MVNSHLMKECVSLESIDEGHLDIRICRKIQCTVVIYITTSVGLYRANIGYV